MAEDTALKVPTISSTLVAVDAAGVWLRDRLRTILDSAATDQVYRNAFAVLVALREYEKIIRNVHRQEAPSGSPP